MINHLFVQKQKQPSRDDLKKRCSENMQQLYWNHLSAWVLSCKFAAYFQNTYSLKNTSGRLLLFAIYSFSWFMKVSHEGHVRKECVSILFLVQHEVIWVYYLLFKSLCNFMSSCLYFPKNLEDIKDHLQVYIISCKIFF